VAADERLAAHRGAGVDERRGDVVERAALRHRHQQRGAVEPAVRHHHGLGEACLVAFSYAQTGSLGWALIALGAAMRARREGHGVAVRAIWQGYKRGKAARWLPGEDYEQLMSEPLAAARRRLNLTPPTLYDAIAGDQPIPAVREAWAA
jgi:hypothetical protein